VCEFYLVGGVLSPESTGQHRDAPTSSGQPFRLSGEGQLADVPPPALLALFLDRDRLEVGRVHVPRNLALLFPAWLHEHAAATEDVALV
jgi:hypothetical protein